jgi:beta-galactosidase
MMKTKLTIFLLLVATLTALAGEGRTVIDLNGTWEFDQTLTAFPPSSFTRKIPVPGLIHLAEPRIEEYDKFFRRPEASEMKTDHSVFDVDYQPKYSWYRREVFVPASLEGRESVITITKSQYVTQVYINGMDAGTSIACYTPVEFPVTRFLKYGDYNEILVRVGERIWLPGQAAGSTDKEKEKYLPGIWDDVFLSFTGKLRIDRLLVLPSVENGMVTVKAQIRNFNLPQVFYGDSMFDSVTFRVTVRDWRTGDEEVGASKRFGTKRDNLTEIELEIPFAGFTMWSPDNPHLYVAGAVLSDENGVSDRHERRFGMRDFTRKGKFFYLNGEKTLLRGSNITLQRFFEDPDCSDLVWDREWVKRFLIDIPKKLNWNAMRICVGIVPRFWYDLADEYGLMFQNEWFYWQSHGWDDQVRREYTDWVWSDGSHPGIVIWDAINENWDDFIGNTLIPELRLLDPTRIWDAGYMTDEHMANDEMDEPHPYTGPMPWVNLERYDRQPHPLGRLDYTDRLIESVESGVAQLVNEYGWVWLWRDGQPSKLTVDFYKYYLGENSTPHQNWQFQAYWLQLETEWLRFQPYIAGVLAFVYLTNNYGYTGDWFSDIRDLTPTPPLYWFTHAFSPYGVFLNLPDERYTPRATTHEPGSILLFNLARVNDENRPVTGEVTLRLLDHTGHSVYEQSRPVTLAGYDRSLFPVSLDLPDKPGGYLVLAEFTPSGGTGPVISRRYIRVGDLPEYEFHELEENYPF